MPDSYQSEIDWGTNEHERQHNIQLGIDLDQVDQLNTDIALILRQVDTRQALKKRIFENVAANVLPKIIRDVAPSDISMPDKLKTDHRINTSIGTSAEIQGNVLDARHQINLIIDLLSDKPVHALTALYNARGGVAEAVTHQVMNNLDNIYLGEETEPDSNSDFSLSGNRVVDYQTSPDQPTIH